MTLTGALPANSTSKKRTFKYVAGNGTGLEDGILTVTEHTGVIVCRTVEREYLVQEQYPEGPHRVFLMVKNDDAGREGLVAGQQGMARTGDVYECRIPVMHGHKAVCTCTAGATGKSCLHAQALTELVGTNQIVDPREVPDDASTADLAEVAEAILNEQDFAGMVGLDVVFVITTPEWNRAYGLHNVSRTATGKVIAVTGWSIVTNLPVNLVIEHTVDRKTTLYFRGPDQVRLA